MNHPEVKLSQTQKKDPVLFQTHQIEFEIGGKKFQISVQTSTSINRDDQVCVDILDIVELIMDCIPIDSKEINKTLASIWSLFGSEWYEKFVIEEAHKGWSDYVDGLALLHDKPANQGGENINELLSQIDKHVSNFEYGNYVDLNPQTSKHLGRTTEMTIMGDVDGDGIAADLMNDLSSIVEEFFGKC